MCDKRLYHNMTQCYHLTLNRPIMEIECAIVSSLPDVKGSDTCQIH